MDKGGMSQLITPEGLGSNADLFVAHVKILGSRILHSNVILVIEF